MDTSEIHDETSRLHPVGLTRRGRRRSIRSTLTAVLVVGAIGGLGVGVTGAPAAAAPGLDASASLQKSKSSSNERLAAQRAAKERAARQQADRAAKERAQRAARERAQRQQAERAAKERAQRAARERAQRQQAEQAAKERAQRAARERAQRQQAERAAQERAQRAARERAQRQQADRAAQERAQRAARERAQRQQADRAAQERAQRAARERAQRQQADRAAQERALRSQREQSAKQQADRNRALQSSRDRAAAEAAQRAARERAQRQAAEEARRRAFGTNRGTSAPATRSPGVERTPQPAPPALSREAARRDEVRVRRAQLAEQERLRREWILKEQADAARRRAADRTLGNSSVDRGSATISVTPGTPRRAPGADRLAPAATPLATPDRTIARQPNAGAGPRPNATIKVAPDTRVVAPSRPGALGTTPSVGNRGASDRRGVTPGIASPTGNALTKRQPTSTRSGGGLGGFVGGDLTTTDPGRPLTLTPIDTRTVTLDPPIYVPEVPVVPVNVADPIVIVDDASSVTIYADDVDIVIDDPIINVNYGCDNIWFEPAFFGGHHFHYGGWDRGWSWGFGHHRYHSPIRRAWFGFRLTFGGWGFPYVRTYRHFDHYGRFGRWSYDPWDDWGRIHISTPRRFFGTRIGWHRPWRGWYEDVCRPRHQTIYRTVYVESPVVTVPVATVDEAWSEFSVGRAGRAHDMFDGILAAYPDDDDARLGRAFAAARIGDFAPAATDIRRALALTADPINRIPLNLGIEEQLGTLRLRANDHRRSGGNEANALLIIAALRTALGEDAAAYRAIDRAIDLGEVSDAALLLQNELDRRLADF